MFLHNTSLNSTQVKIYFYLSKELYEETQFVKKDLSIENLNNETDFLVIIHEPNFLLKVENEYKIASLVT